MDYVTRQFINLAKHFRKDLRTALSKFDSTLNKQTEAVREATETAKTQHCIPPEVTTHVHLPESVEAHQNAKSTRDEKNYRRATFFVTSLTLAAIVIYAVLVELQYEQMVHATIAAQQAVIEARLNRLQADKAFNATIEEFHLDQRAWVAIVETTGKPEVGKPLDIKVHARNSGKTFAKAFHLVLVDEPVKEGEHPHFAANEAAFSKNIASVSLIAPSGDYFATVRASRDKLTQPDMDVITSGKTKIYVYGRIEYSDIFGCQHWTQFCTKLRSSGDGEYESCDTHNDADDNRCPVTKQP